MAATGSSRSPRRERPPLHANPMWRFEVAHDVGHVPQLEVPGWTLDHLADWLDKEGAVARLTARP